MKSFIIFSSAVTAILVLFIAYSCNKENVQQVPTEQNEASVENRSTLYCDDAETGCTAVYVSKFYYFPEGTSQYKNCEFWVEVLERTCGNQFDVIFIGIAFSGSSDPDCAQAEIDLNDPTIGAAIYNLLEQELLQKVVKQAALDLTNNNLPFCGTLSEPTVAKMTRAACGRTCFVPDRNAIRGYRAVQVPCGNNCCITTYEVCRDWLTGEIIVTQTSLVSPATPCEPGAPQLPCPINTVWSTSCVPKCASTGTGG